MGYDSWYESIKVVPGLDDDYMPYYYAWATNGRSYTGWTQSRNTEHDWAVLTLDRNIGSFTGWMGRQTDPSSSSIYTGTLNTAGYPGDKGGLTMWWDADSGHSASEYNHWYYMDTAGGQSGSPIWRYISSTGDRYILTVHTCGTGGCGIDGKGVNHGTRLNQNKYDQIITWRNSDTPPTDYADLIDDGETYSGFSPTTVSPGVTSFNVWSDVRNVGTASPGGFYVSYYASTNPIISTSDYLIGTDYVSSISPFNYLDSDWSGTFPSIPDGTYWVGWIIDSGNDVTEFDETNNVAYKNSSYQLVVDSTIDLTVTSVNAPTSAEVGDDIAVNWIIKNQGDAPSGSFYNRISLATTPYGTDISLGNYPMSSIADGSSSSDAENPQIPETVSPGYYYVTVFADTFDGVAESDELNNINKAPNQIHITQPDTTPPSNPTNIWSTSHSISTWSKDNTIDVSWSGASDSGSGVYGYSYLWDTSSSTIPDTTVETTGLSTTSSSLSIGNNWYFHIRTRDNAGNWNSDAVHLGPFYIDTSNPGTPSPDDGISGWTTNNDPTFTWSNPGDTGSGVEGYYYELDDSTPNYWQTGASKSYTNIPDGTHTFYVQAKDNAGNLGGVGSHEIKIDTAPPSLGTPAIYSANIYGNYYSGSSVDIRATASDTGSGLNTGTCEYSINNGGNWYSASWDGTYCYKTGVGVSGTINVKFRVKDNLNYQGTSATKAYYRDNNAPGVGVANAPASWQNSEVSASVTCSDGESGCSSGTYKLKTYHSNPGSCPTTYSDYPLSSPQTISSHQWVCATGKDNVGNAAYSAPVEFKVDKIAPTITDDYAYDGVWVSSDRTVTLSPVDTGDSGIKEVKYCTGSGCTPSTVLTSPYQLSYTTDQNTIVRYQTGDNAGNPSAIGEYNVKLDKIGPIFGTPEINSLNALGSHYTGSIVDLRASAIDDGSGINISTCEYSIDSGTNWNSASWDGTYCFKSEVAVSGTFTVMFRMKDTLNTLGVSAPREFYEDSTSPAISITSPTESSFIYGSPGLYVEINYTYTENNPYYVTINVYNTTTVIGNKTITIGLAGGAIFRSDSVQLNESTADGTYDVNISISDKLNTPAVDLKANAIKIDSLPPNLVYITNPGNNSKFRGIIEISAEANDALSGIAGVEFFANSSSVGNDTYSPYSYKWNTTSWMDGSYSLTAAAYDKAGNTNSSEPVYVDVDNTAPSVTDLVVTPSVVGLGESVNISVDVTDANDVNTVLTEVRYPDNSLTTIQMNQGSAYHSNFTDTSRYGRYVVTIIANDTFGNINSTEKAVFVVARIFSKPSFNATKDKPITINASDMDTALDIATSANTTGSIEIVESSVNLPETSTLSIPSLGKYMRINASNDLKNSLSWAIIKVSYTDDEVNANGLDENSLSLHWWNENSSEWIKLVKGSPSWVNDAGVNTGDNFIWANVSHFSYYSVGGELYVPPTPSSVGGGGGGGGAPKPKIVLLANSVDYNLSGNFTAFLNTQGIEIIYTTPENFSKYNTNEFIVILGGPDADEGVGEIVQEVLNESEQDYLRKKGNRKMYVKTNAWKSYGQTVTIIAGSDREQTQKVGEEKKPEVKKKVKGS